MKQCVDCGNTYPNSKEYFHTNKSYKDGLQPYCKECGCVRSIVYQQSLSPEEKLKKSREKTKRDHIKQWGDLAYKEFPYEAWLNYEKVSGTYRKDYKSSTRSPGTILLNAKGEEFTIKGKTKINSKTYYIGNYPNSPELACSSKKPPKNKNSPSVGKTGYTGYGPYNQVDNKFYHNKWTTLINNYEAENIKLSEEWKCFQNFMLDIVQDPLHKLYKESPKEYIFDCSSEGLYSKETSPIIEGTSKNRFNLNHAPIKQIIHDHDETCEECGETHPFTSKYFTRKPRKDSHKELQRICKKCAKKVVTRRYRENKKYGRELTPEERIQIKKEKEAEQKRIAKVREEIREQRRIEREQRELLKQQETKPTHINCRECDTYLEFTPDNFQRDKYKKWGLVTICKTCSSKKEKRKTPPKEYIVPETKVCSDCGEAFPCTQDYFVRDKYHSTGFETMCKTCYYKRPYNKSKSNKPKTPLAKSHKTIAKGIRKHFSNMNKLKDGLKTNDITGIDSQGLLDHFNSGDYTWEDYQKNSQDEIHYHIDHIIPKAYYNDKITFDEDGKITEEGLSWLKKCWNYKNLRIIPKEENQYKSDDIHMDLIEKHNIKHLL